MSSSGRRRLLLALAAAPLAARAQDIETIELRHRSAEQVLPLLQPLVEPGGALTGRGYRLFLRASPGNRQQLRELLRAIDTPQRRLAITVRHELAEEWQREVRGADGSVTIGSRGVEAEVAARAGSARVSTRDSAQRIAVLEGASANIAFGTAVPMTFRHRVATQQGSTEVRGTVYYEALTGFFVRPLLAGDEVTLEVTPEQSMPVAGGIDRSRISTTVRGRLGEWIAVGDSAVEQAGESGGLLAAERSRSASRSGVWLKVEAAEPPSR